MIGSSDVHVIDTIFFGRRQGRRPLATGQSGEGVYGGANAQILGSAFGKLITATGRSQRFGTITNAALRKLDMLNAAVRQESLALPPGNHLEALAGDRAGQHSIRINQQ
jgi:RelE-like HigB toxin of type II HigAB toxin-antitoxin system